MTQKKIKKVTKKEMDALRKIAKGKKVTTKQTIISNLEKNKNKRKKGISGLVNYTKKGTKPIFNDLIDRTNKNKINKNKIMKKLKNTKKVKK